MIRSLAVENALVLEAPPGAGKTTRLPPALLEQPWLRGKEVVVLQPRRLATRLAAQRVAAERGEKLGQTVGYQIRMEDVSSASTRLKYVTEGILSRRLLSEPTLPTVGAVVLDEFHERQIASDLSLALLRRLQAEGRSDLRIIVMSATLSAAPVAKYLHDCPTLRSEGRAYPVEIEFLAEADDRPLETVVLAAVKRLVAEKHVGDVLCFLPGAAEIRRGREACADFCDRHRLQIVVLHGDLTAQEQDLAVRPGQKQKLILSTNVAETSVTIEGVTAVVDSGLARTASHSAWTGLPTLRVAKVSKASAIQRAGRAGRTQPGRCLRLYTRIDYENRAEYEVPEIQRADLTEPVLSLKASGVADISSFPFFEAPKPAAVAAAETLLQRLGAIDDSGAITRVGETMLRFAVHPRLARLITAGEERGVGREAAICAAILAERDIRLEGRVQIGGSGRAGGRSSSSDAIDMLERFLEAEQVNFTSNKMAALNLEPRATREVAQVSRQLARALRAPHASKTPVVKMEEALLLSILKGFPDRVAKRRRPHSPELIVFGGGSAILSESSSVREPEFVVAVDAEQRTTGKSSSVVVRIASKVEVEWLLDSPSVFLTESNELEWNLEAERVDRVSRLSYGNLVLDESRAPAEPSQEVSKMLVDQVQGRARDVLSPPEMNQWLARLDLVSQYFPAADLPAAPLALEAALREWSREARSLDDLKARSMSDALTRALQPKQIALLSKMAPVKVALPARQVAVHYEQGKTPWIESRLQDFFGLRQGPGICEGRLALVLHLLAPNHRAVQVTTDLSGFWERHYPAIRKELMRKYPRHAWPENPVTAQPPARRA